MAILMKKSHPGVSYYGWSHKDEKTYIILEKKQPTLMDIIWGKHMLKIPSEDKLNIVLQIANGMAYLSKSKVIHGDLRSSNIMIDVNMNVKICDFGIKIRKYSKNTFSEIGSQQMGSLLWMEPELMGHGPKYSEDSHVYSFAMMLFELLEEKAP